MGGDNTAGQLADPLTTSSVQVIAISSLPMVVSSINPSGSPVIRVNFTVAFMGKISNITSGANIPITTSGDYPIIRTRLLQAGDESGYNTFMCLLMSNLTSLVPLLDNPGSRISSVIVGPPESGIPPPASGLSGGGPSSSSSSSSSLSSSPLSVLAYSIDPTFAEAQMKKYFIDYLCMFLGITMTLVLARLIYLYLSHKKYTLAYSSSLSTTIDPAEVPPSAVTSSSLLRKIDNRNERRHKHWRLEEEAELQKGHIIHTNLQKSNNTSLESALHARVYDGPKGPYRSAFYQYLRYKFTILDCEPLIFPHGIFGLPSGWVEDTLLSLMSRHRLLRCIFIPKGSMIGGMEAIQLYLVKSALSFSLAAIFDSVYLLGQKGSRTNADSYTTPSYYTIGAFNFFVINPLSTQVTELGEAMLLRFSRVDDPKYKLLYPTRYVLWKFVGHISVLLFAILVLGLLVIASLVSSRKNPGTLAYEYFVLAVLPSATIKALIIIAEHYDRMGMYGSILCGYMSFKIGKRYCEMLRLDRKVEGLDFEVHSFKLPYGLLTFEVVRDRKRRPDEGTVPANFMGFSRMKAEDVGMMVIPKPATLSSGGVTTHRQPIESYMNKRNLPQSRGVSVRFNDYNNNNNNNNNTDISEAERGYQQQQQQMQLQQQQQQLQRKRASISPQSNPLNPTGGRRLSAVVALNAEARNPPPPQTSTMFPLYNPEKSKDYRAAKTASGRFYAEDMRYSDVYHQDTSDDNNNNNFMLFAAGEGTMSLHEAREDDMARTLPEATYTEEQIARNYDAEVPLSPKVKGDIGNRVRLFEKLSVEGGVDEEEKIRALNEAQRRRHLSMKISARRQTVLQRQMQQVQMQGQPPPPPGRRPSSMPLPVVHFEDES